MKATCDTHLFGSRGGYRTVSASPGVSSRERSELEIFSFGQLSDRVAQQGLLDRAAAFGRRLASGRFAVTRIVPGPDDDGGRPTLELRTVLLSREAYHAAARAGLALLLDTGALWSATAFAEGGTLAVAIRSATPTAADDAHRRIADAWHGARSSPSQMVRVGGEHASRVLDLASLLDGSDLDELRWGIGVLSTAVPVDLFTLSPNGSASGRRVVRDAAMAGAWRHPQLARLPDRGPWPSLRASSAAPASVARSGGEPLIPSEWTYTGPLPSFRQARRRWPIAMAAAVLLIAVVVVVVLAVQATRPTGGGERVARATGGVQQSDKESTATKVPTTTGHGSTSGASPADGGGSAAQERKPPVGSSNSGMNDGASSTKEGAGTQAEVQSASSPTPSTPAPDTVPKANLPPGRDHGVEEDVRSEPSAVGDAGSRSSVENDQGDCDPEADGFGTTEQPTVADPKDHYADLMKKLERLDEACKTLDQPPNHTGASWTSEREGVLLAWLEVWKALPPESAPASALEELLVLPRVDGFKPEELKKIDSDDFVEKVKDREGSSQVPSDLCRQVQDSIGRLKHLQSKQKRLDNWLDRLALDQYPEIQSGGGDDKGKFESYACRLRAFMDRWPRMASELRDGSDEGDAGKAWSAYLEKRITGSWIKGSACMGKVEELIKRFLATTKDGADEKIGWGPGVAEALESWISEVAKKRGLEGIDKSLRDMLGVKQGE